MNFINYKLYSNFKEVDVLIEKLPTILGLEDTHNISLVLFEVLANILEHSICNYTKDNIYQGNLKSKKQPINLNFNIQNNELEIIICYKISPYSKPISKKPIQYSNQNGKKIIQYFCKKYSHQITGKKIIEKIFFTIGE
ncbi:hypothetical protein [Helicobacter sp. 13S00477-4]|uniref:hypothetical protein n=1 Tax=Helicobacter sp. 13S00477-4 TaxID=1905759 RepID=UPI000BA52CBC|nr:hypothetical protein [Helicobacter sp. 13S00477-4]PAF51241.1 hypothetical protein BKH44_05905 [Helicobacter sp. 13S00477-4]